MKENTEKGEGRRKLTSGCGVQMRTTLSMPEEAMRQSVGCGWTQLTVEESARRMRTMLPDSRSQMKMQPSSEPAAMYSPSLQK